MSDATGPNSNASIASKVFVKMFLMLWVFVIGFLILSILSFNPDDPSPFSASFPDSQISNKFGSVGALVSSFLVFYLGISSLMLSLGIGYVAAVAIMRKKERLQTLQRLGSLFASVLLLLLLTSQYQINLTIKGVPYPAAGAVGFYLHSFLAKPIGDGGILLACFLLFYFILDHLIISRFKLIQCIQAAFTNRIQRKIINNSKNKSAVNQSKDSKSAQPKRSSKSKQQKLSLYGVFKSSETNLSEHLSNEEHSQTKKNIESILAEFKILGQVTSIRPGPVVTVYNFQMDSGIKLSRVQNLVEDIALRLQADSIIAHPSPENKALAIQVPNKERKTVYLGDTISCKEFQQHKSKLALALGADIYGLPLIEDLSGMPHLLIAGATGAGKSVGLNTLIASLLSRASPSEVKLILVDPKMLELSMYEGIPHLLMPVITEPQKAASALAWAIHEMEHRYQQMKDLKVRNIDAYNSLPDQKLLPKIVIIIDELADLMLSSAKSVETSIQRLAQKARASGIHMLLATQRPSVDVITGVIKANLPCRIAYQVTSKHDSRTILDQGGAEKLLGKGDMLFQKPGQSKPIRAQGAFVSDQEVISFVESIIKSYDPSHFDLSAIEWINAHKNECSKSSTGESDKDKEEPFFEEAIELARSKGEISASYIQRQFKIGYNRAARIVEIMTVQGYISQPDGAKPRKWLSS